MLRRSYWSTFFCVLHADYEHQLALVDNVKVFYGNFFANLNSMRITITIIKRHTHTSESVLAMIFLFQYTSNTVAVCETKEMLKYRHVHYLAQRIQQWQKCGCCERANIIFSDVSLLVNMTVIAILMVNPSLCNGVFFTSTILRAHLLWTASLHPTQKCAGVEFSSQQRE